VIAAAAIGWRRPDAGLFMNFEPSIG